MTKIAEEEKLISFGFKKTGDVYVFDTLLAENQLRLTVTMTPLGELSTRVYDPVFGDEYTLHLVEDAEGAFVGRVRMEYKNIISQIKEKCFNAGYKKQSQTLKILDKVFEKYGVHPDFPFEDDNETMVLRRGDNQKWFAIIMTISPRHLGLDGVEALDVMNIKIDPDELDRIVDNKRYFRAYHMNKKMWTTLILDGRVPTEEIMKRIGDSYNLTDKKKGR